MTRPSGARWSSPGRRRGCHARSVASKTAFSRLDAVSSGPMIRNVVRVRPHDVAQERAEHPRRLAGACGPARRPSPRSRRKSGSSRLRASLPPFACGFAPIRRSPSRRERGELGPQRAVLVEELLRAVAAHPGLEQPGRARGCPRARPAAPGARGTCPRPARRRPPWAPSSPSACAGRSSASAAGRRARRRGRAPGWRRSRRAQSSSAAAIAWCTSAGSSPST